LNIFTTGNMDTRLGEIPRLLMTPERAQIVQGLLDKIQDVRVRSMVFKAIEQHAEARYSFLTNYTGNLSRELATLQRDAKDVMKIESNRAKPAFVAAIASMNPRLIDGRYNQEIVPLSRFEAEPFLDLTPARSIMQYASNNPQLTEIFIRLGTDPYENLNWKERFSKSADGKRLIFHRPTEAEERTVMDLFIGHHDIRSILAVFRCYLKGPLKISTFSMRSEPTIWRHIRDRYAIVLLAIRMRQLQLLDNPTISIDCIRIVSEFLFRVTPLPDFGH
jgi:hypothetical protein